MYWGILSTDSSSARSFNKTLLRSQVYLLTLAPGKEGRKEIPNMKNSEGISVVFSATDVVFQHVCFWQCAKLRDYSF